MIRFALEKPVILVVGIIIVCLFGLAALFRVPIQLIPDLDPRVITVQTIWPGASPQDIEKEILVEQEEFLRNITGLEDDFHGGVRPGQHRAGVPFRHGHQRSADPHFECPVTGAGLSRKRR
jgi:multidrug efflux pump subunit AcrB